MNELLTYCLLVAALAAFVILLITKAGGREFVQVNACRTLARLFSCDFCLSFWLCLILSLILFLITKDPKALLTPFFSTPLTRILL